MKPRILYEHWYFKMPWMKNYSGIVIGRFILVRESQYKASPVLINHEMIHQRQMDKHGVLGFYLIYLKDYLKNLVKFRSHEQAYFNIPFEIEAYDNMLNLNYLK